MKKAVVICLLAVSLAAGGWVIDLMWSAGQFKRIEAHFEGKCNPVEGVVGAEDITIHPETGVAYISSCDRRAVSRGKPGRGAIFAYDLNSPDPVPVNLTPQADPDFQPHGISLYAGKDGRDALLVVNHQGGRQRIDVFDLYEGRLSLRKTVSAPALVSPNDVAAVGPDMFYVTNDHRYVDGLGRAAEEYLRLRLSNVLFYDGAGFVEAAGGIGYANGINISPDGLTLYVCAVTERNLHIYRRNPETNELALETKLSLKTGIDNIEVAPGGDMWIGAHPKLLSFVGHSKDPSKLSPSQVLHLTRTSGGAYSIREIYLNSGDELSGSSVASVRADRLLIGAVFDPGFLDCHMLKIP